MVSVGDTDGRKRREGVVVSKQRRKKREGDEHGNDDTIEAGYRYSCKEVPTDGVNEVPEEGRGRGRHIFGPFMRKPQSGKNMGPRSSQDPGPKIQDSTRL